MYRETSKDGGYRDQDADRPAAQLRSDASGWTLESPQRPLRKAGERRQRLPDDASGARAAPGLVVAGLRPAHADRRPRSSLAVMAGGACGGALVDDRPLHDFDRRRLCARP